MDTSGGAMLSLALIGGRVVDEKGEPVRDAIVGARGEIDQALARTNAQGRFAMGILASQPVRVLARKPGFVHAVRRGVAPWSMNVEVVLARTGSVAGRVVGKPAPRSFRVRILRIEGARRVLPMMISVLRRGDGRFSVVRLTAGRYEIQARASDGREARARFDLAPGEELGGLTLTLA